MKIRKIINFFALLSLIFPNIIFSATVPIITTTDAVSNSSTYTIGGTVDRGDDVIISRGFEYGTTTVTDNSTTTDTYSPYTTVFRGLEKNMDFTPTVGYISYFDFDNSGNLYILRLLDSSNSGKIFKFDSNFNLIASTSVPNYMSLALDNSDNIYLSKQNRKITGNNGMAIYNSDLTLATTSNQFVNNKPVSCATNDSISVYCFDTSTDYRIRRYSNDFTVLTFVGGPTGAGDGQFGGTRGMFSRNVLDFDNNLGIIYASDVGNNRINKYSIISTSSLGTFGTASGTPIAIASSSDVYIYNSGAIKRYDSSASLISFFNIPIITTDYRNIFLKFDKQRRNLYASVQSNDPNYEYLTQDLIKFDTQNTQGTGSFSMDIDVECGTTYYYRPFAVNLIGTTTGETMSFTTPACPVAPSEPVQESTNVRPSGGTTIQTRIRNLVEMGKTDLANKLATEYNIDLPQKNTDSSSVIISTSTATISTSSLSLVSKSPEKYIFTTDLEKGMEHPDVKELQKFLNLKGFIVSQTGNGSIGNETTYFGPATENALIKFQIAYNITPSKGYFGPITRNLVNNQYNSLNTKFIFTKDLTINSEGEDVIQLQNILYKLTYLKVPPTGYFGKLTESAVKEYQSANGINPTGYVGSITRGRLNE